MSTRAIGLFVVASIAACGGADPAPVAVARPPANATPSVAPLEPRRVTVAVDTPMTTASGSTFVAPKGWTVITSVDGVVLEAPDQDASVTFVERREADGAAAIAAAWRTLRFDSHLTPEKITTWPGRGGWDASTFVDYPEGPGTDRFAALARRKGDVWFVTLTAGHVASLGDRRAELRVARNGFRAKGVVDESFRDMKGHVLDAARLAKLEAFVEEGRRAFQIPGVAVAVVQGGKIAFAKGFGVKALGKPAPVTADTLFRVASTTKPLTSAMIAALVGEGRFSWDTRVTELYPGFAVADAELTKRLTMRDMLCGCTGIPYDDLGTGFAYVGVTGEQVLARMHGLAPTAGFRERFQYANTMVAAAGYIAAHARYPKLSLGDAYDRAMRDELFGPLGMRATTFDSKAALRGDHASPHARDVRYDPAVAPGDEGAWISPMKPAGGAWSTASDMGKALAMELANGKALDGRRVVDEHALLARRAPQIRIGEHTSYGLAINVGSDRDVPYFEHLGEVAGYTCEITYMPEQGVGIVTFTNLQDVTPFIVLTRNRLFELLFDGREEAAEDLALAVKAERAEHDKEMTRYELAPDPPFLQRFLGVYRHPLYGKIAVRGVPGGAVLDAGAWTSSVGQLRRSDGAEVLVATSPTRLGWPSFVRHEQDGKVTLELHDGGKTVLFERMPDSNKDP